VHRIGINAATGPRRTVAGTGRLAAVDVSRRVLVQEGDMEFTVSDMTCGHCVGRVTNAIKEVDAGAQVSVDLETKRVTVVSEATMDEFLAAVRSAGYSPAPLAEAA
jgi:copper chaperone CopZ